MRLGKSRSLHLRVSDLEDLYVSTGWGPCRQSKVTGRIEDTYPEETYTDPRSLKVIVIHLLNLACT